MSDELQSFLKARDFLLAHRSDYATAYRDFRWPQLKNFNWALDYFDVMAKGNDKPALWIVDDNGEVKLTFAEMSERSNRVANFLRAQGVKRGDVVLMMLNNVVPLWETMLACMKLGAQIIPATTLLVTEDLKDRFERGGAATAGNRPSPPRLRADPPARLAPRCPPLPRTRSRVRIATSSNRSRRSRPAVAPAARAAASRSRGGPSTRSAARWR